MWSAYAKTNGHWIANKILQGFFGSPIESLCEISVADLVTLPVPRDVTGLLMSPVFHARTRQIHVHLRVFTECEQHPGTGTAIMIQRILVESS